MPLALQVYLQDIIFSSSVKSNFSEGNSQTPLESIPATFFVVYMFGFLSFKFLWTLFVTMFILIGKSGV